MTLQTILQLNSAAISMMKEGRLNDANTTLRYALEQCLPYLRPQDEQPNPLATSADECHGAGLSFHGVLMQVSLSACEISSAWDEVFQPFINPFIIEATEECSETSTSSYALTEAHVSAALLYNLALIHHRKSLSSRCSAENSIAAVAVALKMYELAAAAIERHLVDSRNNDRSAVLYLAITNNIGSIYAHFWETEDALKCVDVMHAILCFLDKQVLSPTTTEANEFEHFSRTVVMLHEGFSMLHAPAA